MSHSGNPELPYIRSTDASIVAMRAEERRLCDIIESEQTSTEEKYQALIDLASLSGVLVDGLAHAA
jgi:hypothetical protein